MHQEILRGFWECIEVEHDRLNGAVFTGAVKRTMASDHAPSVAGSSTSTVPDVLIAVCRCVACNDPLHRTRGRRERWSIAVNRSTNPATGFPRLGHASTEGRAQTEGV